MKSTAIAVILLPLLALVQVPLLSAAGSVPAPIKSSDSIKAAGGIGSTVDTDSLQTEKIADHKLIVYYFHGDRRCSNCLKIEKFTHDAVDSAFAGQLKDSLVFWKVVNTDQDSNKHYRDDYQLYTKSVILSDLHNGKEARWKNLEKVWEYLDDEIAFQKYIIAEINAYLNTH